MAEQASKNTTVIGPDATIKGEMAFDSAARLLGTIEGSVSAKGQFHVADGANCRASINAQQVTIDGQVEGDVVAGDRIELNATATLKGDLTAAKLVVTEGASFTGHCKIGPDHVSGNGQAASTASAGVSTSKSAGTKEDATGEPEVKPARAKATSTTK